MATVVAVAPVVAPAPEAAEAVEAVEAVEAPLDLDTLVVRMAERVDLLRRELALMSGDMKVLRRLAKRTERAGGRRRRAPAPDADRKPSGFARPSELSDELCDFLQVERGSAMARTIVTRMICKHIKDNGLNDAENKRCIDFTKPLAADLKGLLRPEAGAVVTFFNLQRYLKHHIRRADGSTATTETASASATPASISTAEVEAAREAAPSRKRAKREA